MFWALRFVRRAALFAAIFFVLVIPSAVEGLFPKTKKDFRCHR
jgi:hypothetical protein